MKKILLMILILIPSLASAEKKQLTNSTHYRGFTVQNLDQGTLEEAANRWHANQVRYMMSPYWKKLHWNLPSMQAAWDRIIKELPAGLDRAKALNLAVVLDLHHLPNDHPKQYSSDANQSSHDWWLDDSNLQTMIDCWKQLAAMCKDRDQVIWFDIYNEPLDWLYVHKTPSYPPVWPKWAQRVIEVIRKIDTRHPIAVEPGPGMLSWGFKDFPVLKDPCQPVIYSVHMYQPFLYTHQGVMNNQVGKYPGVFNDNRGGWWDRKHLELELCDAIEFQKKHKVRIWVGEFSVARWAPNGQAYLKDCIEVFEKYGWDWNYHALRDDGVWSLDESDEADLYDKNGKYVRTGVPEPGKNLFYPKYYTPPPPGAKPQKKESGLTPRGKVLKRYLERNVKLSGRSETWKSRYRGFTVCSLDKKVLEEAVGNWNANQVRYMMCPVWRAPNMCVGHYQTAWKKILADLPAGLDNARALGLAVVLDLHQLPNDHPKEYSKDSKEDSHKWWYDEDNLKLLIECWKQVAEICKNRDQGIWFDLLNEPTDLTVVHHYPSYPPTLPDWLQKTITEIRKIDTRHPVAVETGPGMLCWGFKGFPPLKDPCGQVIYSVHLYQPVIYTHQGVNDTKIFAWPGVFNDSGGGFWDRKRLEVELAPAIEFQKKYGVRIWVGEFSATRWAPGCAKYLRDCIEVFEKYGWDWNYHALDDAGVWRLQEPDDVDLYNAEGKYIRTGLADPKSGLFYGKYGTPEVGKVNPPKGLTDRGQVLKHYLDRNKRIVRKILIIGNSITLHPPLANSDWNNTCGMAATGEDKDFVHRFYQKVCAVQPQFKPELQIGRIATEYNMKGFESLLPCTADLIVVELGDNYRGKADAEELQKPYEEMLAGLKKGHAPRIYCLSTWGNPALNPWIKKAAENQGATFVDISTLFADPANRAAAEGHFKHGGVAWHPGDRGMQAIADTLWKAVKAPIK